MGDIVRHARTVDGLHVHLDPHLHDWHEAGHFEEDRLAVIGELDGLNRDLVGTLFLGLADLVGVGAIGAGPEVVILFDGPVLRVGGRLLVERAGEANRDALLRHVEGFLHRHGLAGVADALNRAILDAVGLPALEAGDVELAVRGAEARAHESGGELERELHHATLRDVAHAFLQDREERGLAVGEVEHAALERTPLTLIGGHPDLAAVGVIDVKRHPAEVRVLELLGRRDAVREVGHFDEFAGLGEVDVVDGDPSALVVAVGDLTVRSDAHAVRGADTGSVDLELLAVRRDLEDAAMVLAEGAPAAASRIHGSALKEVEVALRVGLEVERELMEVRGDLDVVVEVLVEVGFAVLVEVVQQRDLVATEDVDLLVDDLQAEAVEDAGGVAMPADLAEFVVGELADPDVATPSGEGDTAVLKEVDATDANPRAERILGGHRDGVDDVGGGEELGELVLEGLLLGRVLFAFDAGLERVDLLGLVGLAEHAFRHDILSPVGGSTLGEGA